MGWKTKQAKHFVVTSVTIIACYCVLFCSLTDKAVKDYSVYKPHLMFFGLANSLPHMLFAVGLTLLTVHVNVLFTA